MQAAEVLGVKPWEIDDIPAAWVGFAFAKIEAEERGARWKREHPSGGR